MLEQTLAIIRNTFFESIRQPVVLVLLLVATIMLVVANLTATFTMSDDQKMLVDIGLATVFLFGALLAAFIATNVLTREIENKTVLTVVSKPVGRPVFVIGKFFGVALAIVVASLYMCFVFGLVEHHGAIQTARDPVHLPVVLFGISAGLIALVASVWCNYFYGKVFASSFVCFATPLVGLAYFLSLLFTPHFKVAEDIFTKEFNWNLWSAMVALILANIVLTALAIAISTRLSQVLTVVATVGVFLLGMLSDWLFGSLMFGRVERTWLERARAAGEVATEDVEHVIHYTTGETIVNTVSVDRLTEGATLAEFSRGMESLIWWGGKVGHSVLPNFQVLWLSDAVTQEHIIPPSYLLRVSVYSLLAIGAALSLAVIMFQRREVG